MIIFAGAFNDPAAKKGHFFAFSMAQFFQTMQVLWCQGRSEATLIPEYLHGTLHTAIERSRIRESIVHRSWQEETTVNSSPKRHILNVFYAQ
jgi:NADH:ubiquinone oxidoreductase subunit